MERFRQDNPSLRSAVLRHAPRKRRSGADALVLVTEWPEYRELDWEQRGEIHALGVFCWMGGMCSIAAA